MLPAPADDCATTEDDDCDGVPNDGCACTPDEVTACYSGPIETRGVGACRDGAQTCSSDGMLGSCVGEVLPAVEDCAAPDDEDCSGFACAQPVWNKILPSDNYQFGEGVAVDASGNVFVVGRFKGSIDLGGPALISAGDYDAFLAKLDSAGNHIWSKQFGDVARQYASAVAVDSTGNVAIAGYSNGAIDLGGDALPSGMYVAKFDGQGNLLWSISAGGGPLSAVTNIAFDSAGDVLATGYYDLVIDFGSGTLTNDLTHDVFLAKLSASTGAGLWTKSFGNDGSNQASGMAIDGGDSVLITGSFEGSINLGGPGNLWSSGSSDVFVARYDTFGNHAWSKQFGDLGKQYGSAIAVDSMGNAVVGGAFQGTMNFGATALSSTDKDDVFVAKLNTNGISVWARSFGGPLSGIETLDDMAIDTAGDIVMAGRFYHFINFGGSDLTATSGQAFLAKLTTGGEHIWSKTFEETGQSFCRSVATNPASNAILLLGDITGTIDFGTGPLTSNELQDVILADFAP